MAGQLPNKTRFMCCCCYVAPVVSGSVQPHRQQSTRLPRPWDSRGKSTGVGCHFLLQCRKVKSESEVSQSCPTLSDPMDCSLPVSSIHGIIQARTLEWVAIAFSERYSMQMESKREEIATLTSDKINFNSQAVIRDKEGHYIMKIIIKG